MQEQVKKLSELIRQARKEQKLTQEQLAAMSNVGVRFIRELEHGKDSCHLGKTLLVLMMLGIEVKLNDQSI
ncbi:MAG: helix-turn-helix transcriptional regulator [Candidatus Caenarcaniphilales bacterium]|nr:helix-turn-helix transcriptional regulator [Candidatus Caenarcaniphilales bacterium]